VVWIDAHPDSDTPETGYDGFHAMAASVLLGYGDPEILDLLPATVDAQRFAYAGLHAGEEDALDNVRQWDIPVFGPDDLREITGPLLDWLAETGAGKVAIHLDVDVVDSDEAVLGLGTVPGGLSRAQVRRMIVDLSAQADVVGLTVAEYVPRNLLQLQEMLDGLPLIDEDGLH
jgi:arginase